MASQSDLYTAAIRQGLSPSAAKTAAAVGMAESGGNLQAHNTNAATGDDSYGAWQINMLGSLGPTRRTLFGIDSNDQLFDLDTNARAMKILSANGQDFSPWSAYKNGSYKQFVDAHVIEHWGSGTIDTGSGQSTVGKIADALNPVDELSSAIETLNKTARWVSNSQNWVRVGYVVGGSAMIIVGLVMMIQSTTLGSAVMMMNPAGRVASLAKKGTS